MHHTCAYFESVASVAEQDIAALSDGIMVIQNGHFLPQRDMDLVYAGAAGADLSNSRISTPTLQVITTPFLRNISVAANFGNPQIFNNYADDPLRLVGLEEVTLFGTNAAVGANNIYGILGLMAQYQPAPAGRVFTLRGTATATLTANAWTSAGTVTWQNQLPTGQYACVGAVFQSATAVAGRLTFEGQYWRPGALGVTGVGNRVDQLFRFGGLGTWGTFHNYAMPQVEFLASAADTAETIFLDIVKVA